MELKGSKTEANLMAAFAGESRARNKYTFYAAKAEKDGYKTIGDIFTETAENEREHREIWLTILKAPPRGNLTRRKICIQIWPKRQKKRVLTGLQNYLRPLAE